MTTDGTILVVDDEALNRTLLATNLEEAGYTVELAEDGGQALEMLKEQPFDVVLLDLIMPEVDGYQVLEHIKGDVDLWHLPVIVISAMDDMDSIVRCIEMGATDYLFKPFDPVLLHARINASLAIKRLHDQETAYTAALEHQLELAAAAQRSMLPTRLPEVPGLQFAAQFEPARHVGGDFYDVCYLETGHLGVLLADVSDKGVHAALFMGVARTLFLRESMEYENPVDVVSAVHHTLVGASSSNMFVTALYGVLELETRTFRYVRAGHDEPLLVTADGAVSFLGGQGRALGMTLGGPPVFQEQALALGSGDCLVIYSDGVTDMRNPAGESFGPERLAQLVVDLRAGGADQISQGIYDAVQRHRGAAEAFDDFTLLVIKVE
jgi:sigma-B regulation protein RsbU (phosphoserine phosphatase)